MSNKDAASKLTAARTRLILDKPFLGALVLRLPMKEASPEWCRATATDARSFYYNVDYIESLSLAQTEFMLAHEALHCALSHFSRRGHRVQHRWDLACDFAINPLLVNDGLKPPPNAIVLNQFDGMTAEEIYPFLDDSLDQETLDQHLYDGDEGAEGGRGGESDREPPPDGEKSENSNNPRDHGEANSSGNTAKQSDVQNAPPAPLSSTEREQLAQRWQQYLASAAQQAEAGGKLSGALARLVTQSLQPTLPWRSLLAHYFFESSRNDYNYMRPSRREGEMILPSLRSAHCNLVIGLDVSGSVGDQELSEFVAEINAIKGTLPVHITLLACDTALAEGGPWTCEPWEEFRLPRKFSGGGGTSFAPVFQWVEREGQHPDVMLYFTDAEGEFPAYAPDYPVLWLVKGRATVPWGKRIQLN